ncbi:ATP-dependent helicase/nuclease subunit A (ATP-dependent helicase/nuclease AddA) [Durusdinium trenchii]|uniref:DNA 3'-5' helicase n=1 Tax=Durusdinium trenchii TaxID=1381693 RepID=A0ABP0LUV2_9DINO
MANAGSGKTRVLINRVARLLLENIPPEKILCITFTKAAAAEMAERLFKELGQWALFDDAELAAALVEIEGAHAPARSTQDLDAARKLFARALETPGGLKIQTIHSFCESVLRRFPLEAGAPPGFTILEDGDASRLLMDAIDTAAAKTQSDKALSDSFDRLAKLRGEAQLRELFTKAKGSEFDAARARHDNVEEMIEALARSLNIDQDHTESDIQATFIRSIDAVQFEDARAALAASDKQTEKIAPHVNDCLLDLEQHFITANEAQKSVTLYHDTAAYYRILTAIRDAYRKAKSARASLDFDDLIDRTRRLLTETSSAWVMYKLDQGIDHILVDEAQDTSPAQWAVISALLEDHLSGAGARDANRTFFAVGDMKQSIYSFQGADVDLFEEKEADLGKRLAAIGDYKNVDLQLSFRTTAPVLEFVDALFADPDASEGLGHRGVPAHGVKRVGEAGLVELWPLAPRPEKLETNPWDAPVDQPETNHPVQLLSERVAGTIKHWLENRTLLSSQNRPIEAGDIMILVQSRSALFDAVIRSLAQNGVPVAGADRLKLLEDPAVEDLLSYAKFALLSSDDLSLAEVLKSPLFGFDDDKDLFPLAHPRPEGQSLWAALNKNADVEQHWRSAVDEITEARAVGLRQGPYSFLTHILDTGAPSGRKRFYERLSPSSRDAVDEMLRQTLDFENANPRSLRAFVNWFENNAGEIKREMERADNAVRVMTVHGAKGLEANIVFLLDAHRAPNLSHQDPIQKITADSISSAPIFTGSSERDIALTAAAREDRKQRIYEEYRRLLYVAATRARDRLYICGYELGNDKSPRAKATSVKSWHALAQDAFERLQKGKATGETPFWSNNDAVLLRLSNTQQAKVEKTGNTDNLTPVETPSWLFATAPEEVPPLRLAPSKLADDDEAASELAVPAAMSPSSKSKYFRGRTLHRLLELLPHAPPGKRLDAANRLLARLAPTLDAAERKAWRDEALAALDDPHFKRVFGPNSRAEVAVSGAPKGARPGLLVSGQIDRLIIDENDILIVDYKTNRPPPENVEDTSPAYLAQMAAYRALLQEIYPTHYIQAALLWTFEARLMALPGDMLDHAFARWLAPG